MHAHLTLALQVLYCVLLVPYLCLIEKCYNLFPCDIISTISEMCQSVMPGACYRSIDINNLCINCLAPPTAC